MVKQKAWTYVFLTIWFTFAFAGIYQLAIRPALPASLKEIREGIILAEVIEAPAKSLEALPDPLVITHIDGVPVSKSYEVDNIIDAKRIGDNVILSLAETESLELILIPRNNVWFLILSGGLGFVFFLVSVVVFLNRSQEEETYFVLSCSLFGLNNVISWTGLKFPFAVTLLISGVYFFSFSLFAVTMLYFSLYFPSKTLSPSTLKMQKVIFGILGLFFPAVLLYLHLTKVYELSPDSMHQFDILYRVFYGFISLIVLQSIVNIFFNHRRDPNPINRRKVQWALWGIIVAALPYFALWRLPQVFGSPALISEWGAYIFFIAAPVCFAMAIIKYRLFDIEIVLSRSLVYTLVIAILIGVYLFLVGGLSFILFRQISWESPILTIFAALLIALLFNPLKTRIQDFVNKRFFRIRYDRFQSIREFLYDLDICNDQIQILSTLGTHFQRAVPTQKQHFLTFRDNTWESVNPTMKTEDSLRKWLADKEPAYFTETLINIRQVDKVEANLPCVLASFPKPWVVLQPVGEKILWLLGDKRAGTRFWQEDLDLCHQMAFQAHTRWEKLEIILQKQKEMQKIQTAKMESLRRLVAGTAHELNNPIGVIASSTDVSLKGIQKISDNLDSVMKENIPHADQMTKILNLLVDTNRSSQMAAEKVAKIVVNLRKFVGLDEDEWIVADIHEGLESVIALFEPEIEHRITIHTEFRDLPQIYCSLSALNQVFMNMLKNSAEAIKDKGEIHIKTYLEDDWIRIRINDTGAGIDHKNLGKIFDPGFTTKGVKVGMGLGLSICYKIIEEHAGTIDVSTQSGKGTTFTISLPLQKG